MTPKPKRPKFEYRPLIELTPDPNNRRIHPQKNVDRIASSLQEFGQVKPIVITPDGTIAAGNGTYEAAGVIGLGGLWCLIFDGTVEQARRYAIADNRTAELAEWDIEGLLEDLRSFDPESLPTTGFDADDIAALAKAADRVPTTTEGRKVEFTVGGTVHECPKCGHQWTGSTKPAATDG